MVRTLVSNVFNLGVAIDLITSLGPWELSPVQSYGFITTDEHPWAEALYNVDGMSDNQIDMQFGTCDHNDTIICESATKISIQATSLVTDQCREGVMRIRSKCEGLKTCWIGDIEKPCRKFIDLTCSQLRLPPLFDRDTGTFSEGIYNQALRFHGMRRNCTIVLPERTSAVTHIIYTTSERVLCADREYDDMWPDSNSAITIDSSAMRAEGFAVYPNNMILCLGEHDKFYQISWSEALSTCQQIHCAAIGFTLIGVDPNTAITEPSAWLCTDPNFVVLPQPGFISAVVAGKHKNSRHRG